jgi:(p)ppGpp synthase/HD superfamily hydrolase
MPTIADTVALVRAAHAGQVDKAGVPYHTHPERVLARLLSRWPDATEDQQHAALLHDVVEDTAVTPAALMILGYGFEVFRIVCDVTKTPGDKTPYLDQIARLARNCGVGTVRVKWADNRDNADHARLALLPEGQRVMLAAKYEAARVVLEAAL